MLQASYDLIPAARGGQLQDVMMLLLNGADPTATDSDVSYSSCICILGIETRCKVILTH